MDNSEVAALLAETALLLELAGENPFKVRSYRKVSDLIADLDEEVEGIHRSGGLEALPGVGKGISSDLRGLFEEGTLAPLEELRAQVPPGLVEMTRIRGLGVKRIRAIHETLAITTMGELEYACLENRLVTLKGFGPKMQASVLDQIEALRRYARYFHIHNASSLVARAKSFLEGCAGVSSVHVAGAVRRCAEVVAGARLVAVTDRPADSLEAFCAYDAIQERGDGSDDRVHVLDDRVHVLDDHVHVVVEGGLPLEVIACREAERASKLLFATGSAGHLEEIARRADSEGFDIAAEGLRGEGRVVETGSENDIYSALGLGFVPPEMREGTGEVEAAAEGVIPRLVTREELRGVLHVHTRWSDGAETVAAMADACRERGYEYIGISDHSRSAWYAGGLSAGELIEQGERIAELNRSFDRFRILHGVESDILPDGSLDYADDVLSKLDFVIASVHSVFNMDMETMTARLIKAMENRATSVLGHPTGRLLLGREGYPVDIDALLEAAARLGVMIEINANPYRLDLDWRHLARCRELGIRLLINPDAHNIPGLDHVDFGLGVARKGGLDKNLVANTLPVEELAPLLARRRSISRKKTH